MCSKKHWFTRIFNAFKQMYFYVVALNLCQILQIEHCKSWKRVGQTVIFTSRSHCMLICFHCTRHWATKLLKAKCMYSGQRKGRNTTMHTHEKRAYLGLCTARFKCTDTDMSNGKSHSMLARAKWQKKKQFPSIFVWIRTNIWLISTYKTSIYINKNKHCGSQ